MWPTNVSREQFATWAKKGPIDSTQAIFHMDFYLIFHMDFNMNLSGFSVIFIWLWTRVFMKCMPYYDYKFGFSYDHECVPKTTTVGRNMIRNAGLWHGMWALGWLWMWAMTTNVAEWNGTRAQGPKECAFIWNLSKGLRKHVNLFRIWRTDSQNHVHSYEN